MRDKRVITIIGIIIALIIVIFGMTGCANKDCSSGKITGKYYRKAYTSYTRSGKIMIPHHHPEKWQIELNQSCTFNVSEKEFDKYEIGQVIEKAYKVKEGK